MNYNIIVCYCNNNGIGRENIIPWKITEDLKHFKFITTYNLEIDTLNTVIMGRNTWESLPDKCRPLKDRYNIVLSKQRKFKDSDKVHYISSNIENVLQHIENKKEQKEISSNVFIIGGEQIYNVFLKDYSNIINKIYVTELYSTITCDKFFQKID